MTRGTVILVILAALTAAGAVAMQPKQLAPVQFEETGTEFFPDFKDPTVATALDVVEWNDDEAAIRKFSVKFQEGQWIIPSHHDYPADATERMGKAASSFIGVRRELFYGDDPKEHGEFGLLDPEDAAGKSGERAQRITIKDQAGANLVDILVGKQIPEKEGFRYLRLPDDRKVYGGKVEVDISTDFTDWIEKDLLHIERDDIVALQYDPYTVDEAVGRVVGSDPLRVARSMKDEGGAETEKWVLSPGIQVPKGKALDDAAIRQILGAVDRLQIVGVRARPERLTLSELQTKGFFVSPASNRLFGNEGELHVVLDDGVVYTLFFGEITFDSGLALTAGKTSPGDKTDEAHEEGAGGDAPSEAANADEGENDKGGGNRYMFVDVRYEPELAREFGVEPGDADKSDPKDAPTQGDEPAVDEDAAPKDDATAEADEESGQKRAAELAQRFNRWFFVISDQSFKQIHKERDKLFREPKSDD